MIASSDRIAYRSAHETLDSLPAPARRPLYAHNGVVAIALPVRGDLSDWPENTHWQKVERL